MPYLTPGEIPEGDICRPLSIPANGEWLAIVSGALTELTKPYNWEQFGAVTVEETIARMQIMIDAYYAGCAVCATPGGYRIIRISPTGNLEQLNDNGEWEPATDDYAIPAPDARTSGTETDQICLAAKNAVNVLEQLYENLAESWDENLSEAEAITSLIAVYVGATGFAIAPITWAIAAFFLSVFSLLYGALEYLGADLWTEDFSDQMVCFLVNCASNDAGVVTFDWECFNDQLNSLADGFELSEVQLRLYIQVGFMLYFIGGGDGLNLAGSTTEITSGDCAGCSEFELIIEIDYGTLSNPYPGHWIATASFIGSEGDYRLIFAREGFVYPSNMPPFCMQNVVETGTASYMQFRQSPTGTITTGSLPTEEQNIVEMFITSASPYSIEFDTLIC